MQGSGGDEHVAKAWEMEKTCFGLGKKKGDIRDTLGWNSLMSLEVGQRRQFDLDWYENVLATAVSSR